MFDEIKDRIQIAIYKLKTTGLWAVGLILGGIILWNITDMLLFMFVMLFGFIVGGICLFDITCGLLSGFGGEGSSDNVSTTSSSTTDTTDYSGGPSLYAVFDANTGAQQSFATENISEADRQRYAMLDKDPTRRLETRQIR